VRTRPERTRVRAGHSVGFFVVERTDAAGPAPGPGQPVRLEGREALRLHIVLVAGLALCIAAFTVELWRALDGNTFSWMYVFEWPIFAGFALYMWWHLLHGTDRVRRPAKHDAAPMGPPPPPPAADEKLEAWNRYVRDLETGERADS
jgi:hypothetical protein